MATAATIARTWLRAPSQIGASDVSVCLSGFLRRFVAVVGAAGVSWGRSTDRDNPMDTENSTLHAQREALQSFLAAQARAKQLESRLAPERKTADYEARQNATAARADVESSKLALRATKEKSEQESNRILEVVQNIWDSVTTAVTNAGHPELLPFVSSEELQERAFSEPLVMMRQVAFEAERAEHDIRTAIQDLGEADSRRLYWFAGIAVVGVLIIIVLVSSSH